MKTSHLQDQMDLVEATADYVWEKMLEPGKADVVAGFKELVRGMAGSLLLQAKIREVLG